MTRGVQFDEKDDFQSSPAKNNRSKGSKQPLMIRWVMKLPMVNSRTRANHVLIGLAIIVLLVSLYFWWGIIA